MMPDVSVRREMKKEQEAMRKRLEGLGLKNPVVKGAFDNNKPKEDSYKQWMPVHELVRSAREMCDKGTSFNKCLEYLSEAIEKLAENKSVTVDSD
jgi:hypothetical protein